MNFLISTIIPIFNTEEYLDQTISSVINQTIGFNNIELILINDGSTDKSEKICKAYENKYKNIVYCYQKNKGVGSASNKGIELATGEYITFLGSDDKLHHASYEQLYKSAKLNNTPIAAGKMVLFNKKKEWVLPSHKKIFSKDRIVNIKNDPLLAFNASPANKIFNRDFINKNNLKYSSIRTHVDATFVIPSLFLANEISIVSKICYFWRQRKEGSSISQNYTNLDSIKDLISQRDQIREFLINHKLDDYIGIMDIKIFLFMQRFINSIFSFKKIVLNKKKWEEFLSIYNTFLDDISPNLNSKLPYLKKIELKLLKSNNILFSYILYKIYKIKYGYIKFQDMI